MASADLKIPADISGVLFIIPAITSGKRECSFVCVSLVRQQTSQLLTVTAAHNDQEATRVDSEDAIIGH